jgi:hypothetical protein
MFLFCLTDIRSGIATSVAITMFDDVEERAQAVAVPLLYGLVEAVAIGIYCVWAWKMGWTKAPADENFCTVVTKSYEINHDEPEDSEEADEEEADRNTSLENFGDEAIVASMGAMQEQGASKAERSAGGRGMWSQMRRIFGAPADEDVSTNPEGHADEANAFKTPAKSPDSRKRMTSDFSAETAASTNPPLTPRNGDDGETPAGRSIPEHEGQ